VGKLCDDVIKMGSPEVPLPEKVKLLEEASHVPSTAREMKIEKPDSPIRELLRGELGADKLKDDPELANSTLDLTDVKWGSP